MRRAICKKKNLILIFLRTKDMASEKNHPRHKKSTGKKISNTNGKSCTASAETCTVPIFYEYIINQCICKKNVKIQSQYLSRKSARQLHGGLREFEHFLILVVPTVCLDNLLLFINSRCQIPVKCSANRNKHSRETKIQC